MFTFLEWKSHPTDLTEAVFVKGKDNDFAFYQYQIITFDKSDINNYKVEGQTAGKWSHAIKHMVEIDRHFTEAVLSQVRKTIFEYISDENHPKQNDLNYYPKGKKGGLAKGDQKKLINTVPNAALLNFLDLINDKMMLGKEVLPIEQKCAKFIKTLSDRYDSVCDEILKSAEPLDNFNNPEVLKKKLGEEKVISFAVTANDFKMTICLDVPKNVIVMKSAKGVHTMYKVCETEDRLKSPEGRKTWLKKVWDDYHSQWKFTNRRLGAVFAEFVK